MNNQTYILNQFQIIFISSNLKQWYGTFFNDKSPVLQVRRNFANDISHAVNASVCSNSMHLFVSVGKIFGYLYVLMGSEASCKFSVSSWLFMMCVHDV